MENYICNYKLVLLEKPLWSTDAKAFFFFLSIMYKTRIFLLGNDRKTITKRLSYRKIFRNLKPLRTFYDSEPIHLLKPTGLRMDYRSQLSVTWILVLIYCVQLILFEWHLDGIEFKWYSGHLQQTLPPQTCTSELASTGCHASVTLAPMVFTSNPPCSGTARFYWTRKGRAWTGGSGVGRTGHTAVYDCTS